MGNLGLMNLKTITCKLAITLYIVLLSSCLQEEKSVTLGSSVIDKGINMTSSKSEQSKVEVYLITYRFCGRRIISQGTQCEGQGNRPIQTNTQSW